MSEVVIELEREFEPTTVGELVEILNGLPRGMPVYDSLGELLCLRIYRDKGTDEKFMEVA